MKTILITGAGSGLGLELVKAFAQGGWSVTAVVRDTAHVPAELKAEGITLAQADLTKQESLEALKNTVGEKPLDVLINCAGVYDTVGNSVDDEGVASTVPAIAAIFEVNAIAPRMLSELLASNLEAGEEKLIITISSGMGTYSQMDGYHAEHWPYSASKAAVNYSMISFTKVHPDIKSVLVSPGWMKTKIGGSEALVEPSEVAQSIFELVKDQQNKLPNRVLIDTSGKTLEL